MRVDFSTLMFPCFPCCTYNLIAGADAFGLQFRQLPNHLSHAHAEHTHTHTLTQAQKGTQTIAQLCRAHQPQVRVSHFHCMKIPTTSNQVEGENPALWAHLLMPQLPVACCCRFSTATTNQKKICHLSNSDSDRGQQNRPYE